MIVDSDRRRTAGGIVLVAYIKSKSFFWEPLCFDNMSSPLERIPSDVLHYITTLAASSSVFDPPLPVLNLMQTRSTIHKSLSVRSAPHVYAGIFKSKFDTSASLRNYRFMITDSALTKELVNRFRLLQRCKELDISSSNLLRDLVTAFCMYLESDGRNEQHLWRAGFPRFILHVARTYLGSEEVGPLGEIIVWLLCLALPRRQLPLSYFLAVLTTENQPRPNSMYVQARSARLIFFDLSIYISVDQGEISAAVKRSKFNLWSRVVLSI